ncbi:uncharacterized protein LOC126456123 [Schistocerca serialis cubense]|uniref:uncharacterized protein LOC126456123 n=1 Tax=Schistocerca serialis cubense TaxID=2023355 RepID=UPI00214EABDB|nr:uncharacterized protein LOC126456123 [Schistocerca serialis cubense]
MRAQKVPAISAESSEWLSALIVKCSADEGLVKAEADKAGVFRVKSLALGSVMPEVHRLLAAVEGSAFRPLAARCLRCGDLPADFLVLEDLAAEGFVMAEAGRPPDCEHCAAVLKAYARVHAASARVVRECLRADPLASVRDYMLLLTGGTFRALADQLRAYPEYSKYADRYLQIREDTVDRVLEERSNKDVHLLVMLHGDCWMNNIMFKYDAGEVVDLRFVDFQIPGSERINVNYKINGNPDGHANDFRSPKPLLVLGKSYPPAALPQPPPPQTLRRPYTLNVETDTGQSSD